MKRRPNSALSSPALDLADILLEQMGRLTARITALEAAVQAEISAVQAKYTALTDMHTQQSELDRELRALMRTRQGEIFSENEKVTVRNGMLLCGRETKVIIPQEALTRIKAHRWMEAIRVAESVNRSVVEQWPEERLAAIGAFRRETVKFAYEIFLDRSANDEFQEVIDHES